MVFDLQAFREVEETKPRIKVLVGEFGSGKTELTVNLASYMQRAGMTAAVIDMDLVKPYFRTREHRARLEAQGVTVVAPPPKLAHADLPIMPPDLTRVLASPQYRVVMDVGGAKAARHVDIGTQQRRRLVQHAHAARDRAIAAVDARGDAQPPLARLPEPLPFGLDDPAGLDQRGHKVRETRLGDPHVVIARVVGLFPDGTHPKIVYPAAVVASSKNADAAKFLAFMSTPKAAAVFRKYGFTVLPGR